MEDVERFWKKGTPDCFTAGELARLAARFEWPEYELSTSPRMMSQICHVPREALVDTGIPNPRQWWVDESKAWIRENGGSVSCVQVLGSPKYSPPVEIHKEVDDWFWVVLDFEDRDFFHSSPLCEGGRSPRRAGPRPPSFEAAEYDVWRCDQMSGLLAMLSWAFPGDVDQ
jgi:hypothetical protein